MVQQGNEKRGARGRRSNFSSSYATRFVGALLAPFSRGPMDPVRSLYPDDPSFLLFIIPFVRTLRVRFVCNLSAFALYLTNRMRLIRISLTIRA